MVEQGEEPVALQERRTDGLLAQMWARDLVVHADANSNHERGLEPLTEAELDAEW